MRVGLSIVGMEPSDTVRMACVHRFASVEISLENQIGHLTREDVRELGRQCNEEGILLSVHAPSVDLNLGSANDGIRRESLRQLLESIEIAEGAARQVTIHTGYLPHVRQIGTLEHIADGLRILLRACEERGLVLCVENIYERSIDQLIDYIQLVDAGHLKLTLDLAHSRLYGNYDPAVAIRVLAPYIAHVHLSDNDGRTDLHLPLGTGCLDFTKSFDALVNTNYHGDLILECTSVEDALDSRATLRNSVLTGLPGRQGMLTGLAFQ